MPLHPPGRARWRDVAHEVVFEADTFAGKVFDLGLLVSIVASVVVVMLDSVAEHRTRWGAELRLAEWVFTVAFTLEYVLRLVSVDRPLRYATSFFGVVDFLAILPTYLSLVIPGSQSLIVIRSLRLLRIFRVFKLGHFLLEAWQLRLALAASGRKITVFLTSVLMIVIIMGALMYVVESPEAGFTSIPRSIYWAIVTMTTVGYGDISPQTNLGQLLASLLMIAGYAIIAVPTGIVSVELAQASSRRPTTQVCKVCAAEGHDFDAKFCKHCGASLA